MKNSLRRTPIFTIISALAITCAFVFSQSHFNFAQEPAPVVENETEAAETVTTPAPEGPAAATPDTPVVTPAEPQTETTAPEAAPEQPVVSEGGPEQPGEPDSGPQLPEPPVSGAGVVEVPAAGTDPGFVIPEVPVNGNENGTAEGELEIKDSEEKSEETSDPVDWRDRIDVTILVFLAVLFGTFFLGKFLAQMWRMPDYNIKFFILLFCFFGSLVSVFMSWHRIVLGIDLRGGAILVYEVKPNLDSDGNRRATYDMDELSRAIKQRVDPSGIHEITVNQLGANQIQVIIPQTDEAESARIQRIISESGSLEFRILASTQFENEKAIIDRALADPSRNTVYDAEGKVEAWWVPVSAKEKGQFLTSSNIGKRTRNDQLEVLILMDDYNVTGRNLDTNKLDTNARDEKKHQPALGFGFDTAGGNAFGALTTQYAQNKSQPNLFHQLGIILNGELYSAPSIDTPILNGSGVISFSPRTTEKERQQLKQDIMDLYNVLKAGALPAELSKEPISNQQIGATLGKDTIQQASNAILWAAICVLGFMLVYYRFAGLVACFCVITNLLLIVAVMLSIRAAFTLPGLAGLVLTIGMAVDANILIYERMREEIRNGGSLKMAIRNGFTRARSAIVDSNVTTLITAVILYIVGTEQLKGFAVTLFLGVVFTLFTVLFGAKIIFEVFDKWESIKTLHFMQIFNRPNYNFMGPRKAVLTACAIIFCVSIICAIGRGTGILDIDFSGGVSCEIVLEKPLTDEEVREKLKDLPDRSVNHVLTGANQDEVGGFTRFIVNTSTPVGVDDVAKHLEFVQAEIEKAFEGNLVYNKIEIGEPEVEQGVANPEGDNSNVRNRYTVKLKFEPGMNAGSVSSQVKTSQEKAVAAGKLGDVFPVSLVLGEINVADLKPYSEWTITYESTEAASTAMLDQLREDVNTRPYFPTSDKIGSAVAAHTRGQAILAIVASLVCILIYIRWSFHNFTFGFAAIIGLVFNVVFTLGLIAVSPWLIKFMPFLSFIQISEFKIGLPVVAAFLTIIGYALNDTIILFDRIREIRGKSPRLTLETVNTSINQTLSRTILTAFTTFFVVFILYLFGGPGIHTFAFALCCGVAIGTFSTIFISAPVLYWMIGTPEETEESRLKNPR